MLNDGCKCSSQKCPLSDDFTSPSAPRSSPCSFDYRSYQLHCLEIKPCEAQGEIKPCEALCLTHGCTSCWSWAGVGLPGRIGPTPPASRQCLDNSVSRKGLGSCWGAGREVTAARAAARPSGSQECPPPRLCCVPHVVGGASKRAGSVLEPQPLGARPCPTEACEDLARPLPSRRVKSPIRYRERPPPPALSS